jgi:plastocyanin
LTEQKKRRVWMKLVWMGISIPIVLVAAVAVSACGSDDEMKDGSAAPATTAPAAATDDAGDVVQVEARDFAFVPTELEATEGDPITVEVTNAGSAPHTLTVYADEEFTEAVEGADTESISGGGSGDFTTTFEAAGKYFFRCEIHPGQMQGELTVQ